MQKIGFCDKFSLTQAVLSGTKTMTRRLEKGLQRSIAEYEKMYHETFNFNTEYQSWSSTINKLVVGAPHATIYVLTRYKLNEVVAVAQAYKDFLLFNHAVIENSKQTTAGTTKGWSNKFFVKPDFMPHQIQITGVRIERFQAISDDDCFKEGVLTNQFGDYWFKGFPPQKVVASMTPREAFALLIDRPGVGRKGLWKSNPWVVVYTFKLIK